MNQLAQQLKSGELTIQELPMPVVDAKSILVRNHYSIISAGTESSTVQTARKSLIGKAQERPEQVKQVLDVLQKQGPVQTYRAVMKKLDAYSPLGYSCAGEVIEVGSEVTEFTLGDKVACAGAGYANHAEVVSVPVNLCVRLEDDADLKLASYNTLGSIALQGIRQADMRLGESCTVIGLGLLGQLTCMMLRASGVKTIGIDIDAAAVDTARQHCADFAWQRSEGGIMDQISLQTNGLGVDAVIITAGTSSLDPVNFAGSILRKKGRVVVVGAVPTGFDRDPDYYRKELDLRMSCSYGPGRYDLNYEEKGLDYPPAYVRWTEKRNMEAFQNLIYSSKIDLGYLTTHEFSLDDAPKAYDMIVGRTEPFLGVVLKYNVEKPITRNRIDINPRTDNSVVSTGKVGIGFIGVGSYAQGNLLPNIPKNDPNVICRGVMDANGAAAKRVAERFNFEFCASKLDDIFSNDSINTVFVATRHDSHAEYVLKALNSGKNVFVEKPLCLKSEELDEIERTYIEKSVESEHPIHMMIGFNRRFAPLTQRLKQFLGKAPMSMIYRVNAGAIPFDTWIQDPTIGGGRILGEVCHFIDYLTFMCGAMPVRVYVSAMKAPHHLNDTVSINIEFVDGSVGVVSYLANGSKSLPKEYIEIYQSGMTGVIRDFKELEMYSGRKPEVKKPLNQDKGQPKMISDLIQRIKQDGAPLIPPAEIVAVMRTTFAVIESLKTRQVVELV